MVAVEILNVRRPSPLYGQEAPDGSAAYDTREHCCWA
jgi:hypothetical protein